MADKAAAEKSEKPTSKQLSKARDKGQVPQSEELKSFFSILILVTMVASMSQKLMHWFVMLIEEGMSCNTAAFSHNMAFINFFNVKIVDLIFLISPILAALCVGAIIANIVVSGYNFSPGALGLKFNALNPAVGLGNLVNAKSLVKFLASIIKIIFVSLIVWLYLQNKLNVFATLRWAWSIQILAVIAKLIFGLILRICLALLILGVADVFYQKWKYTDDLKMTKQEVKDERSQSEGNPQVKGRIRRMQIKMAMRRMLQEVPKANVVLVNPTHIAVALRYDAKTMEAPLLVAKGADHLAEKIREIARAYGVPIVRKPELARMIYSTVKLDEPIPSTLYVAVAETLAMIHRLRHRRR